MEQQQPGNPPGTTGVPNWVLEAPISDRALRIYVLLRSDSHPPGEPTVETLATFGGRR
ncbi:MAG TPA: hypothetical protein VGJ13_19905 [Pseudonocardiaceae bacterium]|jgi:hypothetical protein